MKHLVFAAIGLIAPLALTAAPAHAKATERHYDCTKAGNANKAACKGAVPASVPKPAAPSVTKPTATRNYDCSKPGNANKAACKVAVAPAPKPTATRNYDCSKAGNANKAVCKGVAAAPLPVPSTKPSVARPSPAPTAARPAPAPRPAASATSGSATAKCRDGSLSYAAHHSGACSHHGGVAQFY